MEMTLCTFSLRAMKLKGREEKTSLANLIKWKTIKESSSESLPADEEDVMKWRNQTLHKNARECVEALFRGACEGEFSFEAYSQEI